MSEAIISRATHVDDPLPLAPGYHMLRVTLKSEDGRSLANAKVNCQDGNTSYNYTTNEKGQVLFSCNSGIAVVSVGNIINGIQYCDIVETSISYDCPISQSQDVKFIHNRANNAEFLSSGEVRFIADRIVNNLYIVGGGAGGDSGGNGGGSGYMNNYYNQKFYSMTNYNFISGSGGINGNAGGTSYIENTEYSAIGGSGRIGGLGNGGNMKAYTWQDWMGFHHYGENGGNSPVNFAGGGGAGCIAVYGGEVSIHVGKGGTPGGGGGAGGEAGTRGGGGGGYGGNGGNGLLRIEF